MHRNWGEVQKQKTAGECHQVPPMLQRISLVKSIHSIKAAMQHKKSKDIRLNIKRGKRKKEKSDRENDFNKRRLHLRLTTREKDSSQVKVKPQKKISFSVLPPSYFLQDRLCFRPKTQKQSYHIF